MKSLFPCVCVLVLASLCQTAPAQGLDHGASLLPLPQIGGRVASAGDRNTWDSYGNSSAPVNYASVPARTNYTNSRTPTNYATLLADDPESVPSPSDNGSDSPYLGAMSAPWGADCGNCGKCASCAKGPSCGKGKSCCAWFGSAAGLLMTRDDNNPVFFSYDDTDESIQLLQPPDMEWSGGFDIRVGRTFGPCCQYAWEAVYWGVFAEVQETNLIAANMPGNLNTTYDFGRLNYNDGVNPGFGAIDSWFNDAERHRLRRSFEFHNVELNLLCSPSLAYRTDGYGDGFHFGWGAGVRYFQFNEGLEFASDDTGVVFGDNPEDEVYYRIDVENHLIGAQVGARADYGLTDRFGFYGLTKIGVFANHINHRSFIGGNGGAAFVGAGPNAGRDYDVRSSKDDVSFLAELDLGMNYQITSHWRAMLGYRAVAVTGVALTTNQIPYNFAGIDDVADIDSNGSLILHGGYAGVEFAW